MIRMAWTPMDISDSIADILRDKDLVPDILYWDHCVPESRAQRICGTVWRSTGYITRGTNEGIHVNVGMTDAHGLHIDLRTYKTLRSGYEAWCTMAKLMADFQWECDRFLDEHSEEFDI